MFRKLLVNEEKKFKLLHVVISVSVCSIILVCMTIFTSCAGNQRKASTQNLINNVNVFAGNASVGHTSPCATTPSGMIKVGPESGNMD